MNNKIDKTSLIEKEDHDPLFPFATTLELNEEQYNFYSSLNNKERLELARMMEVDIVDLKEGKEFDDRGDLLKMMLVLGYHEEAAAFSSFLALAEVPTNVIEARLGDSFVFEDWPRLLSCTSHGRWDELKEQIQKTPFEDNVSALLEAARHMVLSGQIPRESVILFIKDYLSQILNGMIEPGKDLDSWVNVATDLWPGECLEEIRELYGLRWVETLMLDIDYVIKVYQKDFEEYFKREKQKYRRAPFMVIYDAKMASKRERQMNKALRSMRKISQKLNKVKDSISHSTSSNGRNDSCPCGSGKKFKRCCLGITAKQSEKIQIESYTVTWEPLEDSTRDEEDLGCFETIGLRLKTKPEECIYSILFLMKKYPEDPALYNYLYICYVLTDRLREAHELLLKTVKLFPDYLFGLTEFASYLLRRGEYDKVLPVFKGAKSLKQLYPERDVFHISEVKAFHYTIGKCYVKIAEIEQAKVCLSILEKFDKEGPEVKDLRREVHKFNQRHLMNDLLGSHPT